MHLGGMGGTGKSQVIKALIEMFKRKNETHRFIVLAPTGTAAALLNGSTYHSILGIRISDNKKDAGLDHITANTIEEVRLRLSGVDYIFIDEISMIGCPELYQISRRLAAVKNIFEEPFGGMNMILASDFAQLPPIASNTQFYRAKYNRAEECATTYSQECVLGKLLWLQITTVVILKENMRQKSQSALDVQFRTCLENMRYAACTTADIAFMRTRQTNALNVLAPSLSSPEFNNVSIITARNSYRDKFNEVGSKRFAAETGQVLQHFYSYDRQDGYDEEGNKTKRARKAARSRKLTVNDQEELWGAYPCTSGHISGCLSLCLGMPIMLRNNDATELCITKGQEGYVVGWDSFIKDSNKKLMLKTLYVKLINPPKDIKIPHLPLNVVPIPTSVNTIRCEMTDGTIFSIQRQQVIAALNFAMTDYASQGKTRLFNIVHLIRSRNHQSYYTALSRSSSAKGTMILGPFDPEKITKGIDGYLRQEFRELELLNTITALNYDGHLPSYVCGSLRGPLIHSYREWKKKDIDTAMWHPAIRFGENEQEYSLPANIKTAEWDADLLRQEMSIDIYEKKNKRKLSNIHTNMNRVVSASPRQNPSSMEYVHPEGFQWDSVDWSCGYDSFFVILYNLWATNPQEWTLLLNPSGLFMRKAMKLFSKVVRKDILLDQSRDILRKSMHSHNPEAYPMGPKTVVSYSVLKLLLGCAEYGSAYQKCPTCKKEKTLIQFGSITTLQTNYLQPNIASTSIASLIDVSSNTYLSEKKCKHCFRNRNLEITTELVNEITATPPIIAFELINANNNIKPNVTLTWNATDKKSTFILCGLIYGGDNHFTSRYIDYTGTVWYHDGITTGSTCIEECVINLQSDTSWLQTTDQNKSLITCIYRNSDFKQS